jgi:hypothetical protein
LLILLIHLLHFLLFSKKKKKEKKIVKCMCTQTTIFFTSIWREDEKENGRRTQTRIMDPATSNICGVKELISERG